MCSIFVVLLYERYAYYIRLAAHYYESHNKNAEDSLNIRKCVCFSEQETLRYVFLSVGLKPDVAARSVSYTLSQASVCGRLATAAVLMCE
jgi:hypothetical protein